ncbi:MAG: group I intron-associated PD-(D/E)XK endonuclease [Candidatus Sulfotelmatobacter sp.]
MAASSQTSSRKRSKRPPPRRPNTKQTGERSEAAFLHRASGLGFGVAKPWGDSLRYDFILDNGERLWRIQIKCTESLRAQAYETRATYTTGKGRAVYTARDIDFLVVHVVPLDVWYVVPVAQCTPQPMLRFYPHRQAKKMRLEKYREAWHQLKPTHPGANGPITIQAVADETLYATIPEDIPPADALQPSAILSEAKDPCTLPDAIP